jgi:hypothetical protein
MLVTQKIAPRPAATSSGSPSGRVHTLGYSTQAPPSGASQPDASGSPRGLSPLEKRARKKAITVSLANRLAAVTPCPVARRGYERSRSCCAVMVQGPTGKVITSYCKARFCLVCSSIRSADKIHRYGPELRGWSDKQMVTLSIRNVPATGLRAAVKGMLKEFAVITQWLKRRHGDAVKMLRSVEVTYNAQRDDVHPHIHIIVAGADIARDLRDRWLFKFPSASIKGQDIRPCFGERPEIELLKYSVNLSVDKKSLDGKRSPVPAEVLDLIYRELRSIRLIGAIGFVSAREAEPEQDTDTGEDAVTPSGDTISPVEAEGRTIIWTWSQPDRDWICEDTGQLLTGYVPSRRIADFIIALEAGP